MLDVSSIAVLDYKDLLFHKCQSGASQVGDFITSCNDAFILGAYFNEWEPLFCFPYKLTVHLRHVEERLAKLKDQLEYWCKSYTSDMSPDTPVDFLQYCNFIMDKMLLDNEADRRDLCLYLGMQYGQMNDIGFINQLGGSLVFVRTASGPAFIGRVRTINPNAVVLLSAHELRGRQESLSEIARNCAAEPAVPYVVLYDAVEVRPCTMEHLHGFIQRTGYTTYGKLVPVESSTDTQNENL